MLSVIHANNGWDWSNLPACYRKSPFLTLDNGVIFKNVDHIKINNEDHAAPNTLNVQNKVTENSPIQEEEIRSSDIPKPTYPKRTSVTRCCDLLARLKNLVHECTNLTALETLGKDLELTLTKFESSVGEGNTNLTLSAPQKRPKQKRKRKIPEQKDVQSVSSKKEKLKNQHFRQ